MVAFDSRFGSVYGDVSAVWAKEWWCGGDSIKLKWGLIEVNADCGKVGRLKEVRFEN